MQPGILHNATSLLWRKQWQHKSAKEDCFNSCSLSPPHQKLFNLIISRGTPNTSSLETQARETIKKKQAKPIIKINKLKTNKPQKITPNNPFVKYLLNQINTKPIRTKYWTQSKPIRKSQTIANGAKSKQEKKP